MTVPPGCLPAGAPPTLHTIRIMLSICLHLLLESGPARSLFISVPASPLSQRRERSAAHGTLRYGFQPLPDVYPANASNPSRPLERTGSASRRSRALRISHITPETACPAATQIRCSPDSSAVHKKPSPNQNKSVPERRAVSSYSLETAPGKPSADSHSARRCDESAVLRSAACGRSSPSATPITLHTATVIRQQGLRLVFRDPVLTHLRHSTLPGSPAATVPGRGRCALPSASSPLPSSPQAACTAAPHRPVRSAHSPDL